ARHVRLSPCCTKLPVLTCRQFTNPQRRPCGGDQHRPRAATRPPLLPFPEALRTPRQPRGPSQPRPPPDAHASRVPPRLLRNIALPAAVVQAYKSVGKTSWDG